MATVVNIVRFTQTPETRTSSFLHQMHDYFIADCQEHFTPAAGKRI